MDESSPVYQNFKNKMSAMTGRPKMNVTNMKTIFGDGKGRAVISGRGSTLVRGSLDNNKLFQAGGTGNLGERIAANERKITSLKNILKAQKPFGGKEDELLKINLTLQSIGNIITTDYANRINESKLENKLLRNQIDAQRKSVAERSLEKVGKIGSSVGSGISSIASKVTSPIAGIFDKLLTAATLLGAGIASNAAVKWWTNLDPQQQDKVVGNLKTGAVIGGAVIGYTLLRGPFKLLFGLTRFGKRSLQLGGAAPKIFKYGFNNRALSRTNLARQKIFKTKINPQSTVRTGLGGNKGFFGNLFKGSKGKVASSVSSSAAKKTVVKQGAKFTAKKGLRVAAGSAPILGFLVDGGFAVERLLKGDTKSAGIYATSALASFIPKLGTVASVGLTVAGMQSSAEFDAKNKADKLKENENVDVIYQEINKEKKDKNKQLDQNGALGGIEGTQVPVVTSIDLSNEYMVKTPEILGIILGDN